MVVLPSSGRMQGQHHSQSDVKAGDIVQVFLTSPETFVISSDVQSLLYQIPFQSVIQSFKQTHMAAEN